MPAFGFSAFAERLMFITGGPWRGVRMHLGAGGAGLLTHCMPHVRNRYLLAADYVLLGSAAWLAFLARFEGAAWPASTSGLLRAYLLLAVPAKLVVLWRLGMYARLWRYAGIRDLEVLAVGVAAAGIVGAATGLVAFPLVIGARVPVSVLALDALIGGAALAVTRLLVRIVLRRRRATPDARRAVIVGAGAAGSLIVREVMESKRLHVVPVAFVDDDPDKQGRKLHGVRVAGRLADLAAVIEAYLAEEVIVAMPSASGAAIRDVLREAAKAGVPTRTVPGLYELIQGHKSVSALRKVAIEDLLSREPVLTDLARVSRLATDKVVLVTGAGGSIGSELCRQIARLGPARLIAVGRGENSVFELLQELRTSHPELATEAVIADVRDRARLERVFRAHRPSTVFHAAAHKHVPLMEQNVSEAILNNVLGTKVVAELASAHGAERFVLISSDKAVRPSSVMGATKRLAEGVVQRVGARSACRFMSVRFGNVLGSRGSVVPTFLRQIAQGGPITITHPDMRRYFMTIPEAVQLVLQAGAMGEGGEVFVLDMGEPVRVLDLARDLVRLSGLVEGQDVEIRFTGMRPGEKLYEELFFNHENAAPTEHAKILRARNAALDLGGAMSLDALLALAAHDAPSDDLRRGIKALIPEYTGVQPLGPTGTLADLDRPTRDHDMAAHTFPSDAELEADAELAADLTASAGRRGEWGGAGLPARTPAVRPAP